MDAVRGASLVIRGLGGEESHRERIVASLRSLAERGTTTLFVFGAEDEGIPYFERHLAPNYGSLLTAEGAELALIEVRDHTFRPLWSHAVLRRTIEGALTRAGFLEKSAAGDSGRAPVAAG
jgi:hypothetical protein